MRSSTVLVVSKPNMGCLRLLEKLPPDARLVVGNQLDMFRDAGPEADVLMNVMSPLALFRDVWKLCPNLRWVHSFSAGIENSLFPELVDSPVPMTNGRGVFSRSLAEFTFCGMMYFDKKIALMNRQKAEGRWANIDEVWELYGKTLGIVSYGTIGQACAHLAKAFGMRVLAMRRRPELSASDPLVDQVYGLDGLRDMLAASDFVAVCSPKAPGTVGLIGEAEIAAMRPHAVIVNVGRGPVIVESALVDALRSDRIRGAVLDVFDTEPLPEGHPFYTLDNVLLSPHSADHTPGWTDNAMEFFLENFARFEAGQPLENLVDKKAGY
jgi:phosphoglycerate dehydrogenase-like enzyme